MMQTNHKYLMQALNVCTCFPCLLTESVAALAVYSPGIRLNTMKGLHLRTPDKENTL